MGCTVRMTAVMGMLMIMAVWIVKGELKDMTMVLLFNSHSPGNPLPPSCGQHGSGSQPGAQDCPYGKSRDTCGNIVCLKGPGEMCGGKFGR